MTSTETTISLARDERRDLADFLAKLTPEQWDAPTLCTRWRVHDVVAHVYSYEELSLARVTARMVRTGFNNDRANAIGVTALTALSNAELLAYARDHIQPRGLTAMMGGKIALTDGMIHQQDIRRPLGQPRDIPTARLAAALDTARTAPTLAATKRIRGLTLKATDLDWTTGDGPIVEGPGEALLMAITGRKGITPELSGPGLSILAARITP
ncbi:MAG: hypothetical protein QOH17_2087 [Pseudonocardiales bacterium]|jgi:uncharacterized protein (TIGR03083 family)|nr:hypothetical protein [Pseudonocardiales bacterium]